MYLGVPNGSERVKCKIYNFTSLYIDTQEAPKSLSLCSSSSLESVVTVEDEKQNDSPLKSSSTNTLRVSGSNGSGAFTSYVRKRGEPDGRTASDASTQITKVILN